MAFPLHLALEVGDLDEVQRLVQTPGIEVDAVYMRRTPLRWAAEHNQIDIARLLIVAGANVNWMAVDVPTPLQFAAFNGHKEMAILLLQAGADINSSNSTFQSPLVLAGMNGHPEVAHLLIERGADVRRAPSLYSVASRDDVDLLQELLDAGADPNGQKNAGIYPLDSPLHGAAMYGHRKCVQALLAANANPNLKNSYGEIALTSALDNL